MQCASVKGITPVQLKMQLLSGANKVCCFRPQPPLATHYAHALQLYSSYLFIKGPQTHLRAVLQRNPHHVVLVPTQSCTVS